MVAQRLTPVAGFDIRRGEHILTQGAVGHRVEQIVLLAEVPVDAGDPDAEVLAEQRHAQVVYRYLFREFECAADDVIGIEGPAFASLTLISGSVLGHYGTSVYGCVSNSSSATVIPIVGFLVKR